MAKRKGKKGKGKGLRCTIREAKKIYKKTKGSKGKWRAALKAGAKRCKRSKK